MLLPDYITTAPHQWAGLLFKLIWCLFVGGIWATIMWIIWDKK